VNYNKAPKVDESAKGKAKARLDVVNDEIAHLKKEVGRIQVRIRLLVLRLLAPFLSLL